jgi:hydrogenase maturation protein HypF
MKSACSIRVRGVVQGVGFRPFVYRLARANTLGGWVLNGEQGVEIFLEGTEQSLDDFVRDLTTKAPPAASIAEMEVEAFGLESLIGQLGRAGPCSSSWLPLSSGACLPR